MASTNDKVVDKVESKCSNSDLSIIEGNGLIVQINDQENNDRRVKRERRISSGKNYRGPSRRFIIDRRK